MKILKLILDFYRFNKNAPDHCQDSIFQPPPPNSPITWIDKKGFENEPFHLHPDLSVKTASKTWKDDHPPNERWTKPNFYNPSNLSIAGSMNIHDEGGYDKYY